MRKIKLLVIYLLLCLVSTSVAYSQDKSSKISSLEELLNTEITTVSKTPESAFEAATAVYVITKEDIRRSGATNIPDLLRLAPGVQVAQSNASKWAVSIRGFNDEFSNKLLVLMDGRSVYNPISSGVNWDVQDTLIEDIKQIEIIRGPGATLWGANAVNGVINIVTEEAVNTQDNFMSVSIGTKEQIVSGRHGGKTGKSTNYRTYAKYLKRSSTENLQAIDSHDGWDMLRGGFRIDSNKSSRDLLTLQGDVYAGFEDRNVRLPTTTSPFYNAVLDDEEVSGANILGRWNHVYDRGSNVTIQSYVDYANRNLSYFNQQRLAFDVDLQYNHEKVGRHQLVAGLGYRVFADDIEPNDYLTYTPTQRIDNLYSAFIQDRIALIPDKLSLTIGSKFEHNNYTDFEHQPSARLAYTPNTNHTVWASVAKAVRVPNRNMDDILFRASGSTLGFVRLLGNRDVKSEELVAYEMGYRAKLHQAFSFDLTTFYNSYDNLASNDSLGGLDITAGNANTGKTMGWEASARWNVTDFWFLSANYTNLIMDLDSASATFVTTTAKTPQRQLNVSSHIDLPYNMQFNTNLFHSSKLQNGAIPSFIRLDANLTWEAQDNMELSLVGQNLTDNSHQEFTGFIYSDQAEIPRNISLNFKYYF